MNSNTQEKIPCTVAFLTWNSNHGYLRRTLESVKDFAEIIFIDGGSTDGTLDLAREYGVKVVSQSNPGQPITDFARERQIGLDAATYDWHLWLDSDDVVSPELANKIREVATDNNNPVAEYWVKMKRVRPSDLKEYKTFFKTYQPRLFRKTAGAHFARPIHERPAFSKAVAKGRLDESWMILLGDESFDFKRFKERERHRVLSQFQSSYKPVTLSRYVYKGITRPLIGILKSIVRITLNKIIYGLAAMPVKYDLFKIYGLWIQMKIHWTHYVLDRNLKK